MAKLIRKHWPLITGSGILWIAIALFLTLSVRKNQGHLVYVLDDPYIHMSIAKNVAQHGVWGINAHGFASSSSSPLWTVLLSLFYILFGVNEVSPLILNIIFGTLLVSVLYLLLRRFALQSALTLTVLLAVIFFAPLPPLIFCGQEHTMHTLIVILFVYLSARVLSDEKPNPKIQVLLVGLAVLGTTARYEGLFLVLVVSILLALRGRWPYSLYLGGAAILPLAIYGAISVSKGWYFLPNPVLFKGNMPDFSNLRGIIMFLGYYSYREMLRNPHILFLLILSLIIFISKYRREEGVWRNVEIMNIIFVATTFLHMQFARTGWFFRYEAYLVTLGIFIVAIGAQEYFPKKLSIRIERRLMPKYLGTSLLIIIIILPFANRARRSLKETVQATTNIYEQQYQMGLFLRRFYQGNVAANDIGAINYLADINCLDLLGLADSDVARSIRNGLYSTEQIYQLAKQKAVKIAIVHDHWFEQYGGMPSQWVKVGEWKIFNNIVCGSDVVSFYAVDTFEEDSLIENLKTFSSDLPEGVMQSGKYTR